MLPVMPVVSSDRPVLHVSAPSPASVSFSELLDAKLHVAPVRRLAQNAQNDNTPPPSASWVNSEWFFQWILFQMMLSSADSGDDGFLPPAFFPNLPMLPRFF